MRIARPPEGFAIVLSDIAQQAVATASAAFPRFDFAWSNIVERLKYTAHREGAELPNGDRLVSFPADAARGDPKIAVVYHVLGDAVTIRKLMVVAP